MSRVYGEPSLCNFKVRAEEGSLSTERVHGMSQRRPTLVRTGAVDLSY